MSVLSAGIYAFMSTTLSVGTEVYPSRLAQGATLPALVYQLIPADGPIYTHEGDTGTDVARVQFDCWADTYEAAVALHEELRAAVSGFTGSWGSVHIDHCLLDSPGQDDDDEKTGTFRRIVDAVIQYR
jgi:hypothetical protein